MINRQFKNSVVSFCCVSLMKKERKGKMHSEAAVFLLLSSFFAFCAAKNLRKFIRRRIRKVTF